VKRLWQRASYGASENGFAILLDGRPMRLPGGETLPLRHEPLARAIAEEWDGVGQGKPGFSPADLPLTQLAATALLRIAPDPQPVAEAVARYAASDLLCYRASQPELQRRQAAQWQPWLDWAGRNLDAWLRVTEGIALLDQDPAALSALSRAAQRQDADALAALGVMVPILGSLVLGLATLEGGLAAEEAFRLSCLEELFQEEKWGEDREASHRRIVAKRDMLAAARYVALTRPLPEAAPS
jgi:chaperone required for assembly of F1-ATPase